MVIGLSVLRAGGHGANMDFSTEKAQPLQHGKKNDVHSGKKHPGGLSADIPGSRCPQIIICLKRRRVARAELTEVGTCHTLITTSAAGNSHFPCV